MSEIPADRSLDIGTCSFPQREDYLAVYGVDGSMPIDGGVLDPSQVAAIQKDWHSRGQNGCVFAMRAARMLSSAQWSREVHYELPEPDEITDSVEQAVDDGENQLHSLIFPNITDSTQVLDLIGNAVDAGCLVKEEEKDGASIVRLRWVMGDVQSLVLGFAPLEEVPLTRRAPFTELLFKTKPKTEHIMHENLDHRRDRTHAADLDPRLMGLASEQLGALIGKSERRTAKVLAGEVARPEISAAKARTTFGMAQTAAARR